MGPGQRVAGDTSISKRVEHDIFYLENWSIWLDLKILWLTLFGRETNKNAYYSPFTHFSSRLFRVIHHPTGISITHFSPRLFWVSR